jgi:hypothetical protein
MSNVRPAAARSTAQFRQPFPKAQAVPGKMLSLCLTAFASVSGRCFHWESQRA